MTGAVGFRRYFRYELREQVRRDAMYLIALVLVGALAHVAVSLGAASSGMRRLLYEVGMTVPLLAIIRCLFDYWHTVYRSRGYFTMTLPLRGRTILMASCLRLSIGFAAAAAVGALIRAVSGLAQANPLADLFSPALPYYWTLDPVRALVLTSIEVVADLCIPVQLVCLVTIGCSSRWRYLGSKVPVIATVAWFAAYTSLGALAERLAALGLDDEGALEPNFFFNNIFVSRQIDFTQVFVPLGTNLSVIGFTAVLLWWAVRAIERHTSLL